MADSRLLSVSEFAKVSQMPETTIRHYSRIDLLPPASRGENRYRYYSRKQVAQVNVIRTLQELGVPLSEIKDVMPRRNPRAVLRLLERQTEKISGNMTRWAGARNLLQTLNETIHQVMDIDEDAITIERLPERNIILGGSNDYSNGRDDYDALFDFYAAMNKQYPNLCFHYPVWAMYSEERIKRNEWRFPDRYYIYNEIGRDTIQEHLYAVGYMRCGYGQGAALYEKILDYIDENGFEICGNAYEEYPLNEFSSSDTTQYLMRVLIPVRKKTGAG